MATLDFTSFYKDYYVNSSEVTIAFDFKIDGKDIDFGGSMAVPYVEVSQSINGVSGICTFKVVVLGEADKKSKFFDYIGKPIVLTAKLQATGKSSKEKESVLFSGTVTKITLDYSTWGTGNTYHFLCEDDVEKLKHFDFAYSKIKSKNSKPAKDGLQAHIKELIKDTKIQCEYKGFDNLKKFTENEAGVLNCYDEMRRLASYYGFWFYAKELKSSSDKQVILIDDISQTQRDIVAVKDPIGVDDIDMSNDAYGQFWKYSVVDKDNPDGKENKDYYKIGEITDDLTLPLPEWKKIYKKYGMCINDDAIGDDSFKEYMKNLLTKEMMKYTVGSIRTHYCPYFTVGKFVEFDVKFNDKFKLKGKYLITNVKNTITAGNSEMSTQIEFATNMNPSK